MNRPTWATDHALLALVAKHLVTVETEEMRQLVEAGHLDRDAAAAHVRALRAVAIGWRALAAIQPEPPHLYDGDQGGAWGAERRAALQQALERAEARASVSPESEELAEIAQATAALLWWETAAPSARLIVDTTIAARARFAPRATDLFPLGVAA